MMVNCLLLLADVAPISGNSCTESDCIMEADYFVVMRTFWRINLVQI